MPTSTTTNTSPSSTATSGACEAERRNLQALHAMEVDWGAGVFDYAKIRAILTGRNEDECRTGID